MVKASTCLELFNGHCNHWRLSETAHALVHAQQRRIEEVATADLAAGVMLGHGHSTSSVVQDGPRLEELLADEGYAVVPLVRA